jgi:hypothetical protein
MMSGINAGFFPFAESPIADNAAFTRAESRDARTEPSFATSPISSAE